MKRFCAILSIIIFILQLALVLISWILSAVDSSSMVHSIISAGGIRWFVGSLTHNISSPLLAYIVMGYISYSEFVNSGLCKVLSTKDSLTTQQKFAFRLMTIELCIFISFVLFTTMVPHAILLSVTGNLFPSSFSQGIIPLLLLQVFFLSLIYGVIGGRIDSLEKFWDSISLSNNQLCAVCFIYFLLAQLFYSVKYVFF